MYKGSSPYSDPFGGDESDGELAADVPAVESAFAGMQLDASPEHGTAEERRKLQLTRFVQQCKGDRWSCRAHVS